MGDYCTLLCQKSRSKIVLKYLTVNTVLTILGPRKVTAVDKVHCKLTAFGSNINDLFSHKKVRCVYATRLLRQFT